MNQEIKRFRLSSEVQSRNTPAEEHVWSSFQFVVILMKAMVWRSVSFEIVIPHTSAVMLLGFEGFQASLATCRPTIVVSTPAVMTLIEFATGCALQ
jgi:hypothetical protein